LHKEHGTDTNSHVPLDPVMQRGYIYIFREELRREIEIKMEEVERKNRRNRIGKVVSVITHQAPHMNKVQF
jgi:hypothetical protein